MNDAVSSDQVSLQTDSQSPGQRLAQARKAKGLSLEEVSAQLRLSIGVLKALENDDRKNLPPPTFVSGYLRSYARIVGVSEHELVQAQTTTTESPVHELSRTQQRQIRSSDPLVRFLSYAILIGLLAVSGGWWLVQRETPAEAPVSPQVAQSAPAAPAAPEEAPGQPAANATATAAPGTAGEPVAPTTAPLVVASGTTGAGAATSTPEPVATEPPAEEAHAPVAAPAKRVPPPLTADTPQSKVHLEFTQDCWVSITDKAGRQLAYKTYPAGRSVTLRGEAPFRVFFGYSPGVQVFFNGQAFDHKPFQRNETARFRLGTAEDNAPLTEAN